jgi:bisphosphoglycerate-dependent phosphoglycerate mutase
MLIDAPPATFAASAQTESVAVELSTLHAPLVTRTQYVRSLVTAPVSSVEDVPFGAGDAVLPLEPGTDWDTAADPRYAGLPRDLLPRTESLADVRRRLLPHWYDAIVPDLAAGHTVLVAAHGNSLRALVAHLDRLSPEEVMELNIPTGMPLRYDLDDRWAPAVRGGEYLEPEAAAAAAVAVAAQGR